MGDASLSSFKSFTNSDKILTVEDVREKLIPSLLRHLSHAKNYLSEAGKLGKDTHADDNEAGQAGKISNEIEKLRKDTHANDNEAGQAGKISNEIENLRKDTHANDNEAGQAGKISNEIEKLRKDLNFIKQVFTGLDTFERSTSDLFKVLLQPEHSLDQLLEQLKTQTRYRESLEWLDKQFIPKLGVLSEVIIKLKLLLPSPHKLLLNRSNPFRLSSIHLGAANRLNQLLGLHASDVFYKSQAFKDFQDVYNSLVVTAKLCLLCFAVFPANEVLKKRRLIHWWVGEGLLYPPVDGKKTVEEIANGIFEELTTKGCIEPVKKKRRSDVHSYKMHPLTRSAVIRMAKDVEFFHFDEKGRPTTEFSRSYRACLVNGSRLDLVSKTDVEWEMLQTIFNVNESYPNFSIVEWSRLKNVTVLYLGRWHSRAKHHIEVVDIDFLKGLMFMTRLRFLSLRGVSGIMELPNSLCKLVCLEILDLGACHNLEVLPEKISSLKKLTHLDMSDCYLLDRMPKGIASLSELEVLKGFIIGDHKHNTSCALHDLSGLQKLKKLTINTSREDFPREEEVTVLQGFGSLQKLTIAWGGVNFLANRQDKSKQHNVRAQPETASTSDDRGCNRKEHANGVRNHMRRIPARSLTLMRGATPTATRRPECFKVLEKLDLQCYPHLEAPKWLTPGKLEKLKKLYIRGGLLQSLGQVQETAKWSVETLRMKFLNELKLDWNELQAAFPNLNYVEKFRCPKATFFPCDETGVWLKPGNSKM